MGNFIQISKVDKCRAFKLWTPKFFMLNFFDFIGPFLLVTFSSSVQILDFADLHSLLLLNQSFFPLLEEESKRNGATL